MPSERIEQAGGFLVIKRINWFSNPPIGEPVPNRVPAVADSHEGILTRYRGIEGEAWPVCKDLKEIRLQGGLATPDQFDTVSQCYNRIRYKYQTDFIYCCEIRTDHPLSLRLPPDFLFCGFDYGYWVSEDNHYSSLFNEVIYGKYAELRAHAQSLNDSLLFPTMDVVSRVDLTRKSLLKEHADLERSEDGEVFVPIAIHARLADSRS